jgi:hypothetical protein
LRLAEGPLEFGFSILMPCLYGGVSVKRLPIRFDARHKRRYHNLLHWRSGLPWLNFADVFGDD